MHWVKHKRFRERNRCPAPENLQVGETMQSISQCCAGPGEVNTGAVEELKRDQERKGGELGGPGAAVSKWGQAERILGFGEKGVFFPGLCLFLHEPKLLLSAFSQKEGKGGLLSVCQDCLPTLEYFTLLNLHYKVIIIILF